MRTLVVILGASGSGKTTLRQLLCPGPSTIEKAREPIWFEQKQATEIFPVPYTLGEGWALVGPRSGVDHVGGPAALLRSVEHCIAHRDLTVCEGMLLKNCDLNLGPYLLKNHPEDLNVVWVFMNVTQEENVARLRNRSGEPSEDKKRAVESTRTRCLRSWDWLKAQYTGRSALVEVKKATPESALSLVR